LVPKPKFLVKLAIIRVCVLALGGSFSCMSLITFSNDHWSFSSYCQSAKLVLVIFFPWIPHFWVSDYGW
jgi:hypothetical protein